MLPLGTKDAVYLSVIGFLVVAIVAILVEQKRCPDVTPCPLVAKGNYYQLNSVYKAIYIGEPSSSVTPTDAKSRLYLGDGTFMLGSAHSIETKDDRLLFYSNTTGLVATAQGGSLFFGTPTDSVLSAASKRPGIYLSGNTPQSQNVHSPWHAMREFQFVTSSSSTMALRHVYFKDDTSIQGYQIDTGSNEIVVTTETIYFGKNIFADTILRNRGASVVVNGTVVAQTSTVAENITPLECVELPITGTTNILRITKYTSPSNCASTRLRDRSSRTMLIGTPLCISSETLPELVQSAPGAVSFVISACPAIGSGITNLAYTWYDTDDCAEGTGYSSTLQLGMCLQGNVMFTCENAI